MIDEIIQNIKDEIDIGIGVLTKQDAVYVLEEILNDVESQIAALEEEIENER